MWWDSWCEDLGEQGRYNHDIYRLWDNYCTTPAAGCSGAGCADWPCAENACIPGYNPQQGVYCNMWEDDYVTGPGTC